MSITTKRISKSVGFAWQEKKFYKKNDVYKPELKCLYFISFYVFINLTQLKCTDTKL